MFENHFERMFRISETNGGLECTVAETLIQRHIQRLPNRKATREDNYTKYMPVETTCRFMEIAPSVDGRLSSLPPTPRKETKFSFHDSGKYNFMTY